MQPKRKNNLHAAHERGLIEMTIPEKPSSRLQREKKKLEKDRIKRGKKKQ